MVSNNQAAVWFNLKEQQLYNKIFRQGLTSRPLKDFVKNAFYVAIDEIKLKAKKEADNNGESTIA